MCRWASCFSIAECWITIINILQSADCLQKCHTASVQSTTSIHWGPIFFAIMYPSYHLISNCQILGPQTLYVPSLKCRSYFLAWTLALLKNPIIHTEERNNRFKTQQLYFTNKNPNIGKKPFQTKQQFAALNKPRTNQNSNLVKCRLPSHVLVRKHLNSGSKLATT